MITLCSTLASLCSAKPLGSLFLNFGSDGAVSTGPGFGGKPVLVDTSSHMAFNPYSDAGRLTHATSPASDVTITVNGAGGQQVSGITRDRLPVIRPATNVPDANSNSFFNNFLT